MSTPAPSVGGASAPTHLLYLHGFRSSPKSFKAQRLRVWMVANRPDVVWWCPQLPPDPERALQQLDLGLAAWPAARWVVAGSSLGGFYATVLAERHHLPAVVMNPAVDPARDLAAHIGPQTAWHDPQLQFEFTDHHVDALRRLSPGPLTDLSRYAAVIAQGDELLDWHEMAARYAGARLRIVAGSDHALSDFDDHLPFVVQALGLLP